MRLLLRLACSLLVCCGLLAGGLAVPRAAASAESCSETDLPVSIAASRETVHGQLCTPAGRPPTTVQLLIHGATYNRLYWDFPYQPERYSYQRDMAKHGYTTFAIDRLGTGQSAKPLSVTLLAMVEADAIHQIISHLRAGRVGGVRFERVILVAHSLGSGVATLEAATYHDVDGVILTGTTHRVSPLEVLKSFAIYLHPVPLDPRLRNRGGDPGYATTRPGLRGSIFYAINDADPQVITADEATKDEAPPIGVGTALVFGNLGPISREINVPVLVAVGENDFAFCGSLASDCSSAEALRRQEAPYFAQAAHLSTFVLRGSGHAITLHLNTDEYRKATRSWLRVWFDRSGSRYGKAK